MKDDRELLDWQLTTVVALALLIFLNVMASIYCPGITDYVLQFVQAFVVVVAMVVALDVNKNEIGDKNKILTFLAILLTLLSIVFAAVFNMVVYAIAASIVTLVLYISPPPSTLD